MRVLTVVGNRPQFIKAAAVSHRLREQADEVLVHTGQHYDEELSQVFFSELGIPAPEHRLDLGGGSNTAQTARMLEALEGLLASERPDLVLVYGDTNSTLAGALAAAQAGIPVAHVEAGMRSFDRAMPEELNRVLTDHASALLLCSSEAAAENLRAERIAGRVEVVGDVMVDIALLLGPRAAARTDVLAAHGVEPGRFLLVTAHRAGNVDDPARLERLVALLEALPEPAVFPLHPRTAARLEAAGLRARLDAAPHVRLAPPLGYLEFTALLHHAARGADRLGRRAEGGLPRRRAVRDDALDHGVDRDGRRGLERAGRPRRRGGAGGAAALAPRRAAAALRRRPRGRTRRGRP